MATSDTWRVTRAADTRTSSHAVAGPRGGGSSSSAASAAASMKSAQQVPASRHEAWQLQLLFCLYRTC